MPSSEYYRTQAQLLERWGHFARNPLIAEQLNKRAREMLALADRRDRDRAPPEIAEGRDAKR